MNFLEEGPTLMGVAGSGRRRIALGALAVVVIAAGAGLAWWRARPGASADRLAEGLAAYQRKDWNAATEVARRALKQRPDDPDALRLMARAAGRMGRDDTAQDVFHRVGVDRLTAEDLVVLAGVLNRRGQADQARTVLELALIEDRHHPEVLLELGRLRAAADRMAEAHDLADRLVRVPGWEARGALMLGLLRNEQSDPAGAAEALSLALRRDPTLAGSGQAPGAVRKLLAHALLRAARPAEARSQVQQVLAAGPDAEASWLLSRAWLQEGRAEPALAALQEARGFAEHDPILAEPAPLVGARACAECHADIYRAQRASGHARTFHAAAELADLPWPSGPITDPAVPAVSHAISRAEDGPRWETTIEGKPLRTLVAYALGSGARGVTPIGRDQRGEFRELRLSHYGDGSGWDVTSGHEKTPAHRHDYLGELLSRDALRRCLDCHTTDARAARERIEPVASDRGIGCERCHGPGGNHLKAMAWKFPEPAIGRPRLATAEQVTALCARCHSPRGRPISPEDPTSIRFQGATLTWSRCYTQSNGGLSCVTCHDPHQNASTSPPFYESKCLSCHAPAAGTGDQVAVRHVSCPVNATSDCLKCHMPRVSGVIPHTPFTDHFIRVHCKDDVGG